MKRAWVLPFLATMFLVPTGARADFTPDHANADARAAIREGGYEFCTKPALPLSHEALELCPIVADLPECEGLRRACGEHAAKSSARDDADDHSSLLAWLHRLSAVAEILLWMLIGLVVLAIAIPLVRAVVRATKDRKLADRRPESGSPLPSAPERPAAPTIANDAEILLQRADDHARRGERETALQLYLAAALSALDRRGAVRVAKDRTNGEYVRACKDPSARGPLGEIVREVDRVQFGGQAPTGEDVVRAAERAGWLVRAAAPLMMVAALLLAGCAGGGGSHRGDDPAGTDLLTDVLRRQGAEVSSLAGSLAVLPLPSRGAPVPAVVVNVERTELDTETWAHLTAWVDAGGVLVLAGGVAEWPEELGVKAASNPGKKTVSAHAQASDDDDFEEEDLRSWHGTVVGGRGFASGGEKGALLAVFDDTHDGYAVLIPRGAGRIVGLATPELLTNASLAREGNAALLIAILSYADTHVFRIARAESGVSPPSNPFAALSRAGLGLALVHALVATLVLFWAVGARLRRPVPSPPPVRRAFAEHVRATGALYARARVAGHALSVYAAYVEDRVRARMPRGSTDVAGFLASRAHTDRAVCEDLLGRARETRAGTPPRGDELTVLRDLGALFAAAMAQDKG